jgi:hypothetical protein
MRIATGNGSSWWKANPVPIGMLKVECLKESHCEQWATNEGVGLFITRPSGKVSRDLLVLDRKHWGWLTGISTLHCTLRRQPHAENVDRRRNISTMHLFNALLWQGDITLGRSRSSHHILLLICKATNQLPNQHTHILTHVIVCNKTPVKSHFL